MDFETPRQIYVPKWNVVNESTLDDPDVCRSMVDQLDPPVLFFQLRGMGYDQLFAEFNVGAARQTCLRPKVRMWAEHILREKKKLEGRWSRQFDLLKEKDAKIMSLKSQLSLKEAETAEAIRLCDQVLVLESVAGSKDIELASVNAQVAKLNDDLSSLQLSFGELSAKAATFESQKDSLTDQVSVLETTCYGLCDQMSSYEIFKEHIEAVQDKQVRLLSGRVVELDSDLMTKYLAILGESIGCAIDKGMQDGLVAGIDYGKAGRGLVDIAAYNPFTKSNYVSTLNALSAVDFPLLAHLKSQKDASIVDIMGLLHLEGHAAGNPEANQLLPSPNKYFRGSGNGYNYCFVYYFHSDHLRPFNISS
nr:hypothetical protein [Tanacetum cinerariifolium]